MKQFIILLMGMVLAAGTMGYSPPPTVMTDDCQYSVPLGLNDINIVKAYDLDGILTMDVDIGYLLKRETKNYHSIALEYKPLCLLIKVVEDDFIYKDIGKLLTNYMGIKLKLPLAGVHSNYTYTNKLIA